MLKNFPSLSAVSLIEVMTNEDKDELAWYNEQLNMWLSNKGETIQLTYFVIYERIDVSGKVGELSMTKSSSKLKSEVQKWGENVNISNDKMRITCKETSKVSNWDLICTAILLMDRGYLPNGAWWTTIDEYEPSQNMLSFR